MNTFMNMILTLPMPNSALCSTVLQKHHPVGCRGTMKGNKSADSYTTLPGMYGLVAELKRLTGCYVTEQQYLYHHDIVVAASGESG